jgi:hypothetical protein
MSELYEAAQGYARQGIPVFPVHGIVDGVCTCAQANECDNPGKHPATPRGFKDATDNLNRIEKWWSHNPDYNIGTPADAIGTVIDVDNDRDKPGEISWSKFEEEYGPVPDTTVARTGSGGFHVWFKTPESVPTERLKEFPGIDFQGRGAYVVCPPSRHHSGSTYKFITNHEIAQAPYKWIAAVKDRRDAAKQRSMEERARPEGGLVMPEPAEMRSVKRDLEDLDPDMERSEWIRVGQALHSTNWVGAYELWDSFSMGAYWPDSMSTKYTQRSTRDVWNSFKHGKAISVTLSTLEYMADEARRARRPDTSHIDISGLVESGRKKQPRLAEDSEPVRADLEHNTLRFLTPSMLTTKAPPKWRVDKLFPLAEVAFMVYGAPSSGKTFFVIEDMITTMLGKPFMGRENLSVGGSVYLCLEGDVSLRLLAALHRHGVAPEEANNRIWVGEGSLNLSDEADVTQLNETLMQYREAGGEFQTLYIDTFSRAFGGDDENSSAEVTRAINAAERLARSLGCSVGLVHHTSKNPNGKERGSSAIRGAMNTMVSLGGAEGDAPRSVTVEKQKNGVEGDVGHYKLVNYEVPREIYSAEFRHEIRKEDLQTAVLEMADSKSIKASKQKLGDVDVLVMLIESIAPSGEASHVHLCKMFSSHIVANADGDGPPSESTLNRRFGQARDLAINDGLVVDNGSGKARTLALS